MTSVKDAGLAAIWSQGSRYLHRLSGKRGRILSVNVRSEKGKKCCMLPFCRDKAVRETNVKWPG